MTDGGDKPAGRRAEGRRQRIREGSAAILARMIIDGVEGRTTEELVLLLRQLLLSEPTEESFRQSIREIREVLGDPQDEQREGQ